MSKTTQTPSPGTNAPPAGRPARPADLLGNSSKPLRKVYVYEDVPAIDAVEPTPESPDGTPARPATHRLTFIAEVRADTNAEACWTYAESDAGKDAAMSANPPKLTSTSTGRNGLPEAIPYALEPAVRRKS